MSVLDDPKVQRVLEREHQRAKGDQERLSEIREKIDAAKAAGTFTYDMYPTDVYLAIEPAMGRFLNLCSRSLDAKCIVEFGTSFGISTIYLAAAARETGGHVIGSELEPSKAGRAQANLEEAGLADVVDIRVGNAMQTLQDIDEPVDMLFLDGWKDLYVPVTQLLERRFRHGAVVLADNIHTFRAEIQTYVDYMARTDGRFHSVTLPFESGLHYSYHHNP
ncbi:MAG: class I SAM-dependent methyltransferase [Hyphomicrobiaceae bacterium]|nr:class I SAM-dependent methyltransferase [Hyphomicrobiaceae bacterium]